MGNRGRREINNNKLIDNHLAKQTKEQQELKLNVNKMAYYLCILQKEKK